MELLLIATLLQLIFFVSLSMHAMHAPCIMVFISHGHVRRYYFLTSSVFLNRYIKSFTLSSLSVKTPFIMQYSSVL